MAGVEQVTWTQALETAGIVVGMGALALMWLRPRPGEPAERPEEPCVTVTGSYRKPVLYDQDAEREVRLYDQDTDTPV